MTQCKGYPMCGCVDGSCGYENVTNENAYKHCISGKKVMKKIEEEEKRKNKKLFRETDNSLTINRLHDVGGADRKMNVHVYRTASDYSSGLNLAIIDHKGKYLASVHLDAYEISELVKEITRLF